MFRSWKHQIRVLSNSALSGQSWMAMTDSWIIRRSLKQPVFQLSNLGRWPRILHSLSMGLSKCCQKFHLKVSVVFSLYLSMIKCFNFCVGSLGLSIWIPKNLLMLWLRSWEWDCLAEQSCKLLVAIQLFSFFFFLFWHV